MNTDCCSEEKAGSSISVSIDVTKIVKYVCIAGVIIVSIIFGTRCFSKMCCLRLGKWNGNEDE